MADEAAKISVAVEVELERLKAGLAEAQASIAAMSARTAEIQQRTAEKAAETQERAAARAAKAAEREAVRAQRAILREAEKLSSAAAREAANFQRAIEKEATEAARKVASNNKAIFAGTTNHISEMERLAKRANVLLGVQGAVAGIRVIGAASAAMRGDFDEMQRSIEALPMGLGAVAQAFHGIAAEIVGLNDSLARLADVQSQAASDQAKYRARTGITQDVLAREAQAEAERQLNRGEFDAAGSTLTQDMRRRMDRQRRELEVQGIDRKIIERKIALDIAEEQKKIDERVGKARQAQYDLELERARTQHRNMQEDAEMRARWEKESRERAYKETMERIDAETKARREQLDQYNEALQAAQAVNGGNFVSSISTGLGSFRVAQQGAGQEVARAQVRSAQLLADIKRTNEEMLRLEREKDSLR